MTDQSTARDRSMVPLIAQALTTLAHLYAHGRVTVSNLWTDTGTGPGVTAHDQLVVRADVSGHPISRGALLGGLAPITEPQQWEGTYGTYREWQGSLLTMRVVVSERYDDPLAGQETVAVKPPTVLDEPPIAPTPTPPPSDRSPAHRAARAVSWTKGTRAGHTAAKYRDPIPDPVPEPPVDHRPLLGLLVDERFGDLKSHIIEVHGEPGQSTKDLAAKYSGVPGVVVVPGRDRAPDDKTVQAWKNYAIARAIHYFETNRPGERFATLADALTAVNVWPGRDMLEDGWAVEAAQRLVDPSAAEADRDPATADAARGRLRRLVPPALRGHGGEVVIR